jgi:hypothetical protein
VSWVIHNGPLPVGADILHTCDNPPCGNPEHLFPGTQADNIRDMIAKGRQSPASIAALRELWKRRGEDHSQAKLCEADILTIRGSSEKGRVLAKRFDVHEATISKIRNRRSWKHLP